MDVLEEIWSLSARVLELAREQGRDDLVPTLQAHVDCQDAIPEASIDLGIEYGVKFPLEFLQHLEAMQAADPYVADLEEEIDYLREYMGLPVDD